MNTINLERLIIIGISLFLSFHAKKAFVEISVMIRDSYYIPDTYIIKLILFLLIPVETILFFMGCLKLGGKIILRDKW